MDSDRDLDASLALFLDADASLALDERLVSVSRLEFVCCAELLSIELL